MWGIGHQFQREVPAWAGEECNADVQMVYNPGPENPLPGRKVIGRVTDSDDYAQDLLGQGAPGADYWFGFLRPYIERARWVHAWTAPNEPVVQTPDQAAAFSAFTLRLAVLVHGAGAKLVGGIFARGCPEVDIIPQVAQALGACDYLGLHEYGLPAGMDAPADVGWHCLRFTKTWEALADRGQHRPVLILECGIDDNQGGGWRQYMQQAEFLRQLRWYAGQCREYGYVDGIVTFVSMPYGWWSFEIAEPEARQIAQINRELRPVPVIQPVEEPMTALMMPRLRAPVDGIVTQEFGCDARWGTGEIDYSWIKTLMPNGQYLAMPGHNGRDIGAPEGTPVYAGHAGQCWCYEDDTGYGLVVEIWAPQIDGGVFKTIHAHLSQIMVPDRQFVETGRLIGKVGHTGKTTGPHLHWGIKPLHGVNPAYRGWIDPRPFLEAEG
jgi:hypothetical protein